MTITVPEAARRIGCNPETVRRWICEGKLHSTKIGTQHLIEEQDLADIVEPARESAPLPPEWKLTYWGTPMPDVVAALGRARQGR